MVQAKEQYVFVYVAVVELITRILDNVPRAPPKQLKFEKKVCVMIFEYNASRHALFC